jgi:superfamily II DNA helicase RecQ
MGFNALFREVWHIGPPRLLADYVQQVGRAGRDGAPAIAKLFWDGHDLAQKRGVESDMISFCKDKTVCKKILVRRTIMSHIVCVCVHVRVVKYTDVSSYAFHSHADLFTDSDSHVFRFD